MPASSTAMLGSVVLTVLTALAAWSTATSISDAQHPCGDAVPAVPPHPTQRLTPCATRPRPQPHPLPHSRRAAAAGSGQAAGRCSVFRALRVERKQLQGLPLKGKHTLFPTPCSQDGVGVGAPSPLPACHTQPEPCALTACLCMMRCSPALPSAREKMRGKACSIGDAEMLG